MGEFAVLLVRQGTVMLADAETIHVSCLSSPWSLDPISHRQARNVMYIYIRPLFSFLFLFSFLGQHLCEGPKKQSYFFFFSFLLFLKFSSFNHLVWL